VLARSKSEKRMIFNKKTRLHLHNSGGGEGGGGVQVMLLLWLCSSQRRGDRASSRRGRELLFAADVQLLGCETNDVTHKPTQNI
jgi:hypothetical protein